MEKNILAEINRNLELMNVKKFLLEQNIYQDIYSKIKSLLSQQNKNIILPKFKSFITIKNIFTNLNIPYTYKFNIVAEIIKSKYGGINNQEIIQICQSIFNELEIKYANNYDDIINEINKDYSNYTLEVNSIIKNTFTNLGVTLNDDETNILRYFLYSFYKLRTFNIETPKVSEDFSKWLVEFFVKNKDPKIENYRRYLGIEDMDSNQIYQKKPNILVDIIKHNNISSKFKILCLKEYIGLHDVTLSAFFNFLLDLGDNKDFIQKLRNYYSKDYTERNADELLDFIFSKEDDEKYQNIQWFITNLNDRNKLDALFLYLQTFLKEGDVDGVLTKSAKRWGLTKFIIKNVQLAAKYDASFQLIANKLNNRRRILTTQLSSIFLEVSKNPSDDMIKKYKDDVQKLYLGYYAQTYQDINTNMIKNLNELKSAIGDENKIEKETIEKLILGFKQEPNNQNALINGICIYLEFYKDLLDKDAVNINQKWYNSTIADLLNAAFNPFSKKYNVNLNNISKQYFNDSNKFFVVLNKIGKLTSKPMVNTFLWGAPINLNLIVKCINVYSKKLKASESLTERASLLLFLYITYIFFNIFYRTSLLFFVPIIQSLVTLTGIFSDTFIVEPFLSTLRSRNINFLGQEGFIKQDKENIYGVGTGGWSITQNVFYDKYSLYFKKMVGLAVENQTNQSFSKILGQNWYTLLIDPAFTNFENGEAFKQTVKLYNFTNNKSIETFKGVIGDVLKTALKNYLKQQENIQNDPELNQTNTTSTTNQIINKTYIYDSMYNKTFVPYFTYENIKSIKLNNIDISRNVIKNQRGGIIIKDVQRNDVENIVITSKYNNKIYKLKNQ